MRTDRTRVELTLLPGARKLVAVHGRELPQRDDLCGAFSAALAMRAAGIDDHDGQPLDQDEVALAAGSVVSRIPDASSLPPGERSRRDYRLSIPSIQDPARSGTTASGLVRAVERLSGGRLAAIPYSGPWTAATLGGLFDLVSALGGPVALLANLATRHLWGTHASAVQLLDYLLDGERAGPPPDWDVGHFACVIGRLWGPGGSLYAIADTYPSLGRGGLHLQPAERLAAALERRDMPAGGVIAVTVAGDAPSVRADGAALGLHEAVWDNGTVAAEAQG